MIGSMLGSYRIVTELGSGAMGTVYYAEHTVIGRRAAIKVLKPELARRADLLDRFMVEARAVNEIRHPNIVDISEIGTQGEHHYLVMELLEGETLGERLEREPVLAPEVVVTIVGQVAAAVGAAHERGIVHRDLKPENVFLTNHPDEPDRVKVLDFGIVKLIAHTGSSAARRTEVGSVIGTPSYMSPEQCLGEEDLDHRSDIYSLGIVAYEALAGRLPFRADGIGKLVLAHVHEPPQPVHEVNPQIPVRLSAAVMRALEKSRDDRYSSMRDLRHALETALSPAPFTRESMKTARVPRRPRPTPRVDPEPLERARSRRVGDKLREIVVLRLAENRLRLPAMPLAVTRALELLGDSDVKFADLAAALETDPLVSARLLRIANSAVYGGKGSVTALEQAVSRLGVRPLRGILTELTAREVFSSRDPGIQASFHAIWRHCVAVAILGRDLAIARPGVDPDAAYVAGLLHDVGKPVVGAFLLEAERTLAAEVGEKAGAWMGESLWLQTIHECHREVGTRLVRSWKLPDAVAATVQGLERWDHASGTTSIINVTRFANELAKREGLALASDDPDRALANVAEGRHLLFVDDRLEAQLVEGLAERVDALTGASEPEPRLAAATDVQKKRD
jgi:putative nucleotidyltransferase with HDIG domain